MRRCLTQGALIPPGQLEHLYEYAVNHRSQLQAPQLVELLACSAGLAARAGAGAGASSASAPALGGGAAPAAPAAPGVDDPWGSAWGLLGTAAWAVAGGRPQQQPPQQPPQQRAAAAAEGPVSGAVVYSVMEALRAELGTLTGAGAALALQAPGGRRHPPGCAARLR